jgi:hypothetical protein
MTASAASSGRTASRIAIALGVLAAIGVGGVIVARKRAEAAQGVALAEALMEVRGEMCSGRNLKGTGVRMEVFASADTTARPVQSGLVPVLDMNVTPSAPLTAGQVVRWSGWIKSPATGKHRFQLPTGVTGRLVLSRAVVLDSATTGSDTAGIDLEEARLYPFTLVVTAGKNAADAGMWLLSWSSPAQQSQPVTRGSLFPPTDAVASPATAVAADR